MKVVQILGVKIDNLSVLEGKQKIYDMLKEAPNQLFVTTLNPEIVLNAHRDLNYRNILNSADLNLCDGFGLQLISFLKNKPIKGRLTGVDLVEFLLKIAEERKLRVLVVVSEKSLSVPEKIVQSIKKRHPKIIINSRYFGTSQNFIKDGIIDKAEVIFVNFGAPAQERFIFENRRKFPNAKILVGVGGAFDFLTGKIRRAPRVFRAIGLEWLWRFAIEPKRFRRIWNAVVVFPAAVLFSKN